MNYHHLYYFWHVAKEGSITKAAQKLHVSQPSITNQIKELESYFGVLLFERIGKKLSLTHKGEQTFEYATQIFLTGKKLEQVLSSQSDRLPTLHIGMLPVLPKNMAFQILQTDNLKESCDDIRLIEGRLDDLIRQLEHGNLEYILSDVPVLSHKHQSLKSELVLSSDVSFFIRKGVKLSNQSFPKCLNQAPLIVPSRQTAVRHEIESWLINKKITPQVIAEVHDSAMIKIFGENGMGVFYMPSVIEDEIIKKYKVQRLGKTKNIKWNIYKVSRSG